MGKMCYANTIKMEWFIIIKVNFRRRKKVRDKKGHQIMIKDQFTEKQ